MSRPANISSAAGKFASSTDPVSDKAALKARRTVLTKYTPDELPNHSVPWSGSFFRLPISDVWSGRASWRGEGVRSLGEVEDIDIFRQSKGLRLSLILETHTYPDDLQGTQTQPVFFEGNARVLSFCSGFFEVSQHRHELLDTAGRINLCPSTSLAGGSYASSSSNRASATPHLLR